MPVCRKNYICTITIITQLPYSGYLQMQKVECNGTLNWTQGGTDVNVIISPYIISSHPPEKGNSQARGYRRTNETHCYAGTLLLIHQRQGEINILVLHFTGWPFVVCSMFHKLLTSRACNLPLVSCGQAMLLVFQPQSFLKNVTFVMNVLGLVWLRGSQPN